MTLSLPLLIIAYLVPAAITLAVGIYAWQRRSAPGVMPFALLMLAVTEWSLACALGLASPGLPAKVFWDKVKYLAMVAVPALWLALMLQYTGRDKWLTRRNLTLLAIEPLVVLLLVWTNELHGLFYSGARLDTSSPFPLVEWTFGTWHRVNLVYTYLLLVLGALLLLQALIRSPQLYRGQAVALLIGVFIPGVGGALSVSGIDPFSRLDLTPLAFTVSGMALAWALVRFRFLDIAPVA